MADYVQTPKDPAKAVVVAQHVIDMLPSTKLARGHYMHEPRGYEVTLPDGQTDLKSIVPELRAHCEVCQLGALVLSKAELFDQVPITRFVTASIGLSVSRTTCIVSLEDIFDPVTLLLLENAFETASGGGGLLTVRGGSHGALSAGVVGRHGVCRRQAVAGRVAVWPAHRGWAAAP